MSPMNFNPCIECGACCALYRASFYWAEVDDYTPDGVPAGLTRKLTPFRSCMLTIGAEGLRCIALAGIIGKRVSCSIYRNRSSVCRDFIPSWENGERNERCDAARAAFQLKPLSPSQWDSPGRFPKAA